ARNRDVEHRVRLGGAIRSLDRLHRELVQMRPGDRAEELGVRSALPVQQGGSELAQQLRLGFPGEALGGDGQVELGHGSSSRPDRKLSPARGVLGFGKRTEEYRVRIPNAGSLSWRPCAPRRSPNKTARSPGRPPCWATA